MDFVVREATIKDVDGVYEMWRRLSFDQLSKDNYYKGNLEFNSGKDQIEEAIKNDNCSVFVVDCDGEILGFIETWMDRKEFLIDYDDYAYILHFYVDEKIRFNKYILQIITRLYKSGENWAKAQDKKYIIADAFNHNQRIIRILRRTGVTAYRTRMVKAIEHI